MKAPPNDIDLGLTVLCELAEYGDTLSYGDIAEVCGCNQTHISSIGRRALAKLKNQKSIKEYAGE